MRAGWSHPGIVWVASDRMLAAAAPGPAGGYIRPPVFANDIYGEFRTRSAAADDAAATLSPADSVRTLTRARRVAGRSRETEALGLDDDIARTGGMRLRPERHAETRPEGLALDSALVLPSRPGRAGGEDDLEAASSSHADSPTLSPRRRNGHAHAGRLDGSPRVRASVEPLGPADIAARALAREYNHACAARDLEQALWLTTQVGALENGAERQVRLNRRKFFDAAAAKQASWAALQMLDILPPKACDVRTYNMALR